MIRSATTEVVVDLDYLRRSIAAGWVPLDPRTLLALIEAVEADHAWHVESSHQNWFRRCEAFRVFRYAGEPK